jgi:hypothetical protein
MIKTLGLAGLCVAALGCMAEASNGPTDDERESAYDAEEDEDVEGQSAAIVTGSPPEAKPCDCAFKGMDICKDPDGDGLLSLYDNCRYVKNANQANCDGDAYGDACDSDNVRVTRRTESANTPEGATGRTTCEYDPDVHSISYFEVEYVTGSRTYETKQYCGPSGSRSETRLVSEDVDHHKCWRIGYFGCDFTQDGPRPSPLCH